jgi:hypothetical protein
MALLTELAANSSTRIESREEDIASARGASCI